MKTFQELKAAVQQAKTPEQAAGTFVDGTVSVIESNKSDPSALAEFTNEVRGWRTGLIGYLTRGPH